MSDNTCPHCGSDVADTNPVLMAKRLKGYTSWYGWSRFSDRPLECADGTTIAVVSKKDKYNSGDLDSGWFDELPQGTEFETFMIFEVTFPDKSVKYYKKTGRGDSYGSVEWDNAGAFTEVQPVTKTVTVFE